MSGTDHTVPENSRPIPFAPGYRIDDSGRIWSCRQSRSINGCDAWRIRRYGRVRDGYHQIILFIDGRPRHFSVHRLVLELFVGPCPEGMEACHNDGNPENNHLSNLRWDSRQGNQADKKRHGTNPIVVGERNPYAKLRDEDIPEIFRLHRDGFSCRRIAKIYGVTDVAISCVLRRKTWRHIPVDFALIPS